MGREDNELYKACSAYMRSGDYDRALDCAVTLYKENPKEWRGLVLAFRKAMKGMVESGARVEDAYELLHQSYLLCAEVSFDDFMIAIEWYRKPEEKFWQVRREHLLPICTALESLANDELDELFISCPPRIGKLLADDTPVLTKDGWKRHGDLVVGDYVYAPDGRAVKVTRIFPKHHTTHTVTFTDGTEIKCHENHEWVVYDRALMRERIVDTKYLMSVALDNSKTQEAGKRGHRYRFQLPNEEPIKGTKKDLPVHPYVLGVWLGDGTNTKPRLTGDMRDYGIIERVMRCGYNLTHIYRYEASGSASNYEFETKMRTDLQKCGMCHSRKRVEKRIPDEYFTASLDQRLELLAGLIDTDGTLAKKEKRYSFTTSEERLRDDFVRLVSTFGWRCCVSKHEPRMSSSGVEGKHPYWSVAFNPTMFIPCELERKQLREFSKKKRIAFKSIVESAPEQGNCISVEGGVYRVGDRLIPTHNSTIVLFFTVWMMLKHPERSNLYSSYTEKVVKTFYNGCLEILGDHITYDIGSVFPKAKIAHTDAADLLIDIGRRKKYPSLTARSVDGTLNGACDADQLVICDDLHSGIDEARSKDQLIKKWETVRANLLSRKKGNAKILWIGTRWSLIDCISNRIEMLETEAECAFIRHKVINIPALNEDGESNFDYMFHKGFSTADYKAIRASYETNGDLALWLAPYMGAPIERSGTVFDPTEMRYYNGELPKESVGGELIPIEPDRVYMVVDPAWGGGDYVAGAVCYQYGDEIYIPEVVYSNGDKSVTQPLIVAAGLKHNISALHIEATRVTASYAAELDARFRDNGYRVNIQANVKNWNGNRGKQQRIFDKAPEIRERLVFLESGKRDKTYSAFMQNVFSFVVEGKNKHDDAPDCLAMIIVCAFRQNARIQLASASLLDRF